MTSVHVFVTILLATSLVSCRLSTDNDNRHNWYQKARLKASCLERDKTEGRNAVSRCWFFEGMKSWFRRSSISWFPGKTKSWNLTELTDHCNDYYAPPKKWTCENTKSLGGCLLPEVQKHCDPGLMPIFHEHQAARQYYLGCDGKLKFKDLENVIANSTTNSTEIEIL
ncbi:hypothetical protein B9Z55_020722 [Caenorhabditis nigoni]|uniref:DUF19 domain-containing protein n=1 Tax=Caenorhabditis nigoni TaxID=1611254 RepID=A0A2G5TNV2_9PELO|nr:hypothetical protein B9Z55_020722 [Caenorhabditis nigoni]